MLKTSFTRDMSVDPNDVHDELVSELEKIKALSLPADPSSYELWYNYAVGRNPDLNRRINRAIDPIVA